MKTPLRIVLEMWGQLLGMLVAIFAVVVPVVLLFEFWGAVALVALTTITFLVFGTLAAVEIERKR